MNLSSDLVSEFAKVMNEGKTQRNETTVYGTISVQNGVTYVKIDGSNELTPVVSAVAVSHGQRVIVTLKQHQAVVTSNLTDPAASSLMVNNMGITVSEQGVAIGKHDGDISDIHDALDGIGITISDDKIVIGDHGKLKELMDGVNANSEDILGISKKITDEIDVHISGLTAFTNGLENGTTIINGGCIETGTLNLSGIITWGDLDANMQKVIEDTESAANSAISDAASAKSTADTAISDAASAKSTADTAISDAASAKSTASSALSTANSVSYAMSELERELAKKITSGDATTLITKELVSSPVIQGGRVSGAVFSNLEATTWMEIGKDLDGWDDDTYILNIFKGYPDPDGDGYTSMWSVFHIWDGGQYISFGARDGFGFLSLDTMRQQAYLRGTWDFSDATVTGLEVSGPTTVTAVFA